MMIRGIIMGTADDFTALIARMDGSFIRDYAYMVSKTLIAQALAAADSQTQAKVLENLSATDREEVQGLLAGLGALGHEEALAAQRELISRAAPYV
jgi:flagellar motor switch protein FliG